MAKPQEKKAAAALRQQGKSVKEIAGILRVSKSTASLWCQQILLTQEQLTALHQKMIAAGHAGRLKGALTNKMRRADKIRLSTQEGEKIKPFSSRDLLLLGLGLYLGEGGKGRRFQFTNSHPQINKLILRWLMCNFDIDSSRIVIRLFINEDHRARDAELQRYWSDMLHIPILQFRRTVFIRARWKKSYPHPMLYRGIVNISVTKSANLQHRINGLLYHILAMAA